MINPCICLVDFKKSKKLTYGEFFTFLENTTRALKIPENVALVDATIPGHYRNKSTIPTKNRELVTSLIQNKNALWVFDYDSQVILLYGCVVVYAVELDGRFFWKSYTHFLLT